MPSPRDEAGFAGGFEALPFGLLVLVVGTLLLVNGWAVVDANLAASAAAREAVRSYVETNDVAAAEQAATAAIEGHGKDTRHAAVHWVRRSDERCEPVTIEVSYRVRGILLPWVGGIGTITTRASHTELVDPWRSGLPVGEAAPCA